MDSKKKSKNRKYASIIQAEEEHLAALSKETNTSRVPCSTDVQETKSLSENLTVSDITVRDTVLKQSYSIETKTGQTTNQVTITNESNNITSTNELTSNKKHKTKKCKKSSAESQNISVKSSFSKFDALQKQNLIHNATSEIQSNCRKCEKPVYKMEEIKAEKSIYHKNCFRCVECKKQLKVDTYQSHESNLYCIVHFKLLFAPKIINDDKPDSHKKPELIIRENQPKELPPDVVRASSKPDLGLEELQQLNVKSRFQIFENGDDHREQKSKENENVKVEIGKRSSSIVSKLVKLKQSGCFMGEDTRIPETTSISNSETDDSDDASDSEDADADLVRSQKRTQRERPIGLGDAMLDIKSKFESGSLLTKEERREERKQEIQNIRSRLFMGKQAKIKEMYQQAVAESEQGIVSASRKPEIEIGCGASSLKEKYEKGTIFENNNTNKENCNKTPTGIADDVEVFDSGISKKSRSIFLELDANLAAERCSTKLHTKLPKNVSSTSNRLNSETEIEGHQGNIVKYDEKQDDIKIQTSEISQKFKFFESYRPAQSEKKKFSITPPREGVVKLPTPESDLELEKKPNSNIDNILEKSQTTSVMLSKFREMENKTNRQNTDVEPRPLKCFTPPPDGGERYYKDEGSDFDSDDDYDDEEEEEEQDDDIRSKYFENDAALKEAQLAARAKFLKAKFEKWEANEIEQSKNCGAEYPQEVCNDQSIESTKALRERFENFNKVENAKPIRSRHQVNRFV